MHYKITYLLILMSSCCFAQNDVQTTLSNLISRMNLIESKTAEDTTAIQILTETVARLEGKVFQTTSFYSQKSKSNKTCKYFWLLRWAKFYRNNKSKARRGNCQFESWSWKAEASFQIYKCGWDLWTVESSWNNRLWNVQSWFWWKISRPGVFYSCF